jgi:DNA-binding NtrC family response regulator
MQHSILVVDDDPELRETIREVLVQADFLVNTAASGDDALDLLDREDFDIVLLDLMMPGPGGMEVLPQIKRKTPRTRVIMITAFATIENAVASMRKGASDYITKPFKVDELLMAVMKTIEEARFQECKSKVDIDDTFNCLANSTRRKVLMRLAIEGRMRFMDIARHLNIEDHTKVNFHLRVLRDSKFIEQDRRKFYILTRVGRKVVASLDMMMNNLKE